MKCRTAPMARPKAKTPARRYHISGQAVVTIEGRDFYSGPHDSPESIAGYAVLIGIYQAGGLKLPQDFDLSELDHKTAIILGIQTAPQHQADEPLLFTPDPHAFAFGLEAVLVRSATPT